MEVLFVNASEFKNIVWDNLRKINENTSRIFDPVCEKYGLTTLQISILMELSNNESHTIGSLAECACIAGANISAMCKKLESMGLLKRVRDKNDERVVKVTLSEKGSMIILEIDKLFNDRISQNMDDEALEALDDIVNGLQKLNNLLTAFQKPVSKPL
jgi:DNA-binding MarR family transcriptional regulator